MTTSADLEELIDSTVEIPTIPTTLMEINQALASEEGSAAQAATIIEKDPAIAARVLRLVNSSLYALRNPVSEIGLACSMIGLKMIRNIVVQASVLEKLTVDAADVEFDPNWLWDHSFKTAFACRRLATAATIDVGLDAHDAYTAGLIHDVGKMVLLQQQPEQFADALRQSSETGMTSAAAEEKVFGFSHADFAGLLTQRWKLSPKIQEAVSYHHHPYAPGDEFDCGQLVRCANSIAHDEAEQGGGYTADLVDSDQLELLGISDEELEAIRAEVRDHVL